MNKPKYLLILHLFIVTICTAQEKAEEQKKTIIGIDVDCYTQLSDYADWENLGPAFSPLITFSKKRHQFEVGPQFIIPVTRFNTNLGLIGIYRFFPNGTTNRFNTYFNFGIPIRFAIDKMEYLPTDVPSFLEGPTKERFFSIYGQIGYGVNFQIYKGLYLGSTFSLNVGYLRRSWDNTPILDAGMYKYNDSEIYGAFNGGLNIGFKF